MLDMDRLKHQCEQLLEPNERILLEANAVLKLGLFRQQGIGRVFLTSSRVLWLHMAPRALLSLLFWLHRLVEIRIDRVQRFHAGGEVLYLSTLDERYELRIAERYWDLFNPFAVSEHTSTAKEWGKQLQEITTANHD